MVDAQWSSGTIYITPHMDIPFSEIVHDVAKILQEKGFTTVLYPPSEKSNIPRLYCVYIIAHIVIYFNQ